MEIRHTWALLLGYHAADPDTRSKILKLCPELRAIIIEPMPVPVEEAPAKRWKLQARDSAGRVQKEYEVVCRERDLAANAESLIASVPYAMRLMVDWTEITG